jgi:hypothetical protein
MDRIIAILDKEYPPDHSFIDGMFGQVLPQKNVKVLMLLTRGEKKFHTGRYLKSSYIATLKKRKGLSRFFNFFVLKHLLENLLLKKKFQSKTILFVRNEPIYLLVSYFYRNRFKKVIYQQSFPHEITKNIFKRIITIAIFKFFGQHVDTVLGVSEESLLRLRKYFPLTSNLDFIPLCINGDLISNRNTFQSNIPLQFIYIGSHEKSREIEIVLKSIINIYDKCNSHFTFVGGTNKQIKKLNKIINSNLNFHQLSENRIKFIGAVSRDRIIESLDSCDIGISLIPPKNIYLESSPTKITEYAARGLAILGNIEIPFINKFIGESGGGYLCDFNSKSISEAIIEIENDSNINKKRSRVIKYVNEFYRYQDYIDKII